MGDAVLGLVTSEMTNPPRWAVVRNLSDPQINGAVEKDLQVNYAVWYYTRFGYWISVMSALATWGIIAGLPWNFQAHAVLQNSRIEQLSRVQAASTIPS